MLHVASILNSGTRRYALLAPRATNGLLVSVRKLVKDVDPCAQVYTSSSRSVVASQVSRPRSWSDPIGESEPVSGCETIYWDSLFIYLFIFYFQS